MPGSLGQGAGLAQTAPCPPCQREVPAMAQTFPCPRCGALQEAMTLPRDWPDGLVARWRALEAKMLCGDCDGVAIPDDEGRHR